MMQSSRQVLNKTELKKPKFLREHHLFERAANLINHTLCHKCSAYCWKDGTFSRPYDAVNNADVPHTDRFEKTVHGQVCQMVTVPFCPISQIGDRTESRSVLSPR